MSLAPPPSPAYIAAQAVIVLAVINPTADGEFGMRPFYRASDYGMENSIGYLVRRSANLLLPQMETLFSDQTLSFSQWTALMALRDGEVLTAADLARVICHDTGSLTRILDQLEKRGLLTRKRSESDRRLVALELTPRGRALIVSLMPRVVGLWNELLGDFSHDEIRLLIKLMTRLTAAAEGRRAAGDQPRRARRKVA
jgi:DNA-binding MarR family transcriptional regulator